VLKGPKAHERSRLGCGRLARFDWVILYREAKLEERIRLDA
jgi:hypothetical protein